MFFYLSKIAWFLTAPSNFFLIILVLAAILAWTRWARLARWLLVFLAVSGLFLAIVPVGKVLIAELESRFPLRKKISERVDGIIVLGGILNARVSKSRGRSTVGGGAERLTEFANLAKRYPRARLAFSGGSGSLTLTSLKGAHFVAPFLRRLGLTAERVQLEDQSRNTAESAQFTKKLLAPGPKERWVLITSAFHMPRAVGSFRRAGWRILAYPVGFTTTPDDGHLFNSLGFNFLASMSALSKAVHEWLGLIFYRLTDRTDALYPAPGGA